MKGSKPAKKLTLKQRKLIKARAEGKTLQQAGEIAGYSPRTAESQACVELKKPQVVEAFNSILDRIGLTDERLATKINDLMDCKKAVSCVSQKDAGPGSVDFVDVDDNSTQLGAAKLAAQLKGHLIEKKEIDVSAALMAAVAARLSSGSDPRSEN